MKISLCVICGNESAHIERMLASFAPAFDELSLVRAVGTLEPDNTVELARGWCAANGKAFVFAEYRNAADLPHVDDFAAARNMAFAGGTGDWLFWADCDDVCDDAAKIREVAASTSADMVRFAYSVPQSGKLARRERLIRRKLFEAGRRWHWPIHENLIPFDSDRVEIADAPTWIHAPDGPKAGGEKRNLRILTAALRDAPTHYYYCHQENFYLRERDKCRRFGEVFLSLPGGNPTLRYQCLLNMSELAETHEEAAKHALMAHHLYPSQKEAVATLVRCAFQEESAERALHWSRLLFFSPPPAKEARLWCYEPKWDGWGKYDLRARALRLAGHDDKADETDSAMRGGAKPMISLLHATRGRVNKAIACRDMWLDLADRPEMIEHIFAVDADDEASLRWLKSFKRVISPRPNCVAAWNEAASACSGDLLIQLSDDWIPPRGWDTLLLREVGQRDPTREPFVLAVSDGSRKDDLLCIAILSRARWEAQGRELFSAEYEGVYSDNEFSYRAFRDGVVVDARHLTFTHAHPAFGKGQMDETYARQNAPEKYACGAEIFRRRNPDAKP